MKVSIKKFFTTVSALALIGTVFIGSKAAFAADSSITGGTLSVTTPTVSNFSSVTLNGQIQTSNANMGSFTVTDPTGTGNGWNVVVKASPFTDSVDNFTLPTDSLTISSPTVTAEAGASDASTVTVANGTIDNATGVKVLSAALNGGMGTYDIAFPTNALSLNLQPKDVKAGTYTSTVSVTVTSGP